MKIIKDRSYQLAAYLLLLPTASLGATTTGNPESEAELLRTLGGESDSGAAESELDAINASDKSDFLRESSVTLRTMWYSRSREAINAALNNQDAAGNIKVNAMGLGLDISSGYLWDMIGVDLGLNGNVKVGSSTGQSEILYYDYVTNQESSEAAIGRASVKFKFGSDDNGLKANIGYMPIDVGTIGSASGLHSHSYRGLETKYTFHDFEFGYAWADQFHNEWTKGYYLDMTNSATQNQPPFQGTGQQIDAIQSAAIRYKFGPEKSSFFEVGVGQGKDYRNNQQVVLSHLINLGAERSLTFIGYYFQGQYLPELSGISNPTNEWHASFGANYTDGPWSFFAAYGRTHAPDSQELNFTLTPWANSDSRNFSQTWGQIDDYIWDGEQVVKAGVNYEIGRLISLPGLYTGLSYNYGWDLANQDADGNPAGTSKVQEIDASITYTVETGLLKGLGAGIYTGWLRGDSDFYGKPNRNDVKFIVSYSVDLL